MSPPPKAGGHFYGPGVGLKRVLLLHWAEMLTCPPEARLQLTQQRWNTTLTELHDCCCCGCGGGPARSQASSPHISQEGC